MPPYSSSLGSRAGWPASGRGPGFSVWSPVLVAGGAGLALAAMTLFPLKIGLFKGAGEVGWGLRPGGGDASVGSRVCTACEQRGQRQRDEDETHVGSEKYTHESENVRWFREKCSASPRCRCAQPVWASEVEAGHGDSQSGRSCPGVDTSPLVHRGPDTEVCEVAPLCANILGKTK